MRTISSISSIFFTFFSIFYLLAAFYKFAYSRGRRDGLLHQSIRKNRFLDWLL